MIKEFWFSDYITVDQVDCDENNEYLHECAHVSSYITGACETEEQVSLNCNSSKLVHFFTIFMRSRNQSQMFEFE